MAKIAWKPGTLLAPLPAVLVASGTAEKPNLCTVAWTGIVCSDPAMTYISLRPSRYSHKIISETREFTINLTTGPLARRTDACGVYTGAKVDKFKKYSFTPEPSQKISAPGVKESPLFLECKVKEIKPLGSHDLFLAEIVGVNVEEDLVDEKGKLNLQKANLLVYSHGEYLQTGRKLGSFGYSVKKK